MAVKLISVRCPECKANLSIESDRKTAFCTYCGAKVLIDNENERIYRRIDEAELRRADTERLIRLKELEIYEREQEKLEKRRKGRIKLSLTFGIIGGLIAAFGMLTAIEEIGTIGIGGFLVGVFMWPRDDDDNNTNKK